MNNPVTYKKIIEGLNEEDLKFLVDNTISIDEFESKISNDAIVVGFKTKDEEPANDLSEFIEKGGTEVLDTEVSPTIDENGFYVVFVEFLRDREFPDKIMAILKSLKSLTSIDEWYFTSYGSDGKRQPATEMNIQENVRLEKKEDVHTDEQLELFKNSDVDHAFVNERRLILTKNNQRHIFEKTSYGHQDLIFEVLELKDKPFKMDNESLLECRGIRELLGYNWDVNKIGDQFILTNNFSQNIFTVKTK